MKAPAFWSRPPGLLAWLLAPFGWIYGAITAWRMGQPGARIGIPVICVGNFTAGGAGKTPTVLMLAEALRARGESPFVVSRGYGGRLVGPVRVDPGRMSAADCGDEPRLLARSLPVIVSRDRLAGARLAEAEGATLVLLDDGLQNPRLAKDCAIAVVDAGQGGDQVFGNGFCLPAGPLRAPVDAQLRHVDAVLSIGDGLAPALGGKPVFHARIVTERQAVMRLSGRPLLAFAGIGRPDKFFDTLRDGGLSVAATRSFADHHSYTADEIASLRADAKASGLTLVTTEKDAIRLPAAAQDIAVLPITLSLEGDALVALVLGLIDRRRSLRPSA